MISAFVSRARVLMESLEMTRGFSEIKLELIRRCHLEKAPQELRLWFSFQDGLLCTHDYDDHKKSIVLALAEGENLKIYFMPSCYGWNLIEDVIAQSKGLNIDPAEEFNDRFLAFGYFTFGR